MPVPVVVDIAGGAAADARHDGVVDVALVGAQPGHALAVQAVGMRIGKIGGQLPGRARAQDQVEAATGVLLATPIAVGGRIDGGAAMQVAYDAVLVHVALGDAATCVGQAQVAAVLVPVALGMLEIEVDLDHVVGPPLERRELALAIIAFLLHAIDAAAGHQVIRCTVGDGLRADLTAVGIGHILLAVAGIPGGTAGDALLRIGALQPLDAQRDTELLAVAEFELVDVAGGTAIADAIVVAVLLVILGPAATQIDLRRALAVLQRLDRLQADGAGDTAFDDVGTLGLVDRHRIDQLGREHVEVHRAVAAAVGDLAAIEVGAAEECAETTDRDFRRAGLVAGRGGTGQRFDRIGQRRRGQVADVIGRQHIGDHRVVAFLVDRTLHRLADAGDLDLVQGGGVLPGTGSGRLRLYGRRSRQRSEQCHDQWCG
ncbi:hypothetical protein D3C72_940360 [compost metagenome]